MAVNLTKETATQKQETKKVVVMSVFLTNLAQYNSGNLVGLWLDLPTTTATIKSALEKIGCGKNGDASFSLADEYFLTDADTILNFEIPEYSNIFALNRVAEKIAKLNVDPDVFNAFMENGYTVQEAIDKIENVDYIYYYGCDDMEDKEAYFNRLKTKSVFLKKEDCVDLPPKVFEVRIFEMDKEQDKHYKNMIKNIQDNINEWSKFEFTAKLMKLREIVSGFVINKDNTISDFDTNKDKLLEDSLQEIGDKPVIIWCQFQHEIDRLAEKYNGVALTSKTNNRDDIIRDFKNNKINRLFTHPKLLGKGLTFVNCTYNIYYSLSFSYEEFRQSQDRMGI